MKYLSLILLMFLVGCGYSAKQNELSGQVKKVVNATPLICSDRVDADISLGIMRNGVGSLSTEDLWVYVPNQEDQKILKEAAVNGKIVKITYNIKRVTFCTSKYIVTKVELEK